MRSSLRGQRVSKPPWLKIRLGLSPSFHRVREVLEDYGLNTVCQGAHCPNIVKCWNLGTATFLILGEFCTRACKFCATKKGKPGALNREEPRRLRRAVEELNLSYVVLTSVTRDDLADKGASHFKNCISELKKAEVRVEALIPDFDREGIEKVLEAEPEVIAHNIETVERLQREIRDRRFSYSESLRVLREIKRLDDSIVTKSSIMLGFGEKRGEVIRTMRDLKRAKVDILTLGQYLRPSSRHAEVVRYVPPGEFRFYEEAGYKMGFKFVASSPFVRSSYLAKEAYIKVRRERVDI